MDSRRRGDVVLVDFDRSVGSEAKRRRPAVVVSNDANNRFAPVLTVVPITSNVQRVYPFDVFLPKSAGLDKDSKAMANQTRTIARERVGRRRGALDDDRMRLLEDAILLHLGLER